MATWDSAPAVNLAPSPIPAWQSGIPVNDPIQQEQLLTQPHPKAPGGIINSVIAGLQSSASGLIIRGRKPDITLAPDAAWYERAASNISGVVADLPEMVVGGAVGSTVGPVGAMAGSFAAPQALREALMTAYEQGGVNSWDELWNVAKAGIVGGGKGAVIGAATGVAGKLVGGSLLTRATAAGPATQATLLGVTAGRTAAEITAMTAAGSMLEGRLPTAQDFMDSAVVIGGLHAAIGIAGRLRNIYAKTGVPPSDVALRAQQDQTLKSEILASDEVPMELKPLAAAENAKAAVSDVMTMSVEEKAAYLKLAQTPFSEIPQEPGTPKIQGHVNYDYINSDAELKGAVSRLAELNQERIAQETRGRVPMTETIRASQSHLADILGTTAEKLPQNSGISQEQLPALNAARAQATVDIAAAWKKMSVTVADAAEAGTLTDIMLAQYRILTEKAGMVISSHLGLSAEVGRSLQILKHFREQLTDVKMLDEIINADGKRTDLISLAKVGRETGDATAALRAAKKYTAPTVGDKIIEAWKASILSGPTTHLANIFGNVVGMFSLVGERYAGAVIGLLHKGEAERVTFTEANALLIGMIHGSLDAVKFSGEAWRENAPMTGKLDQPRGAILGVKGEIIRIPFRALTAEDAFFRTLAERGEAHAEAVRLAFRENLAPGTREFNARIVDLVQNPPEAMAQAVAEAGNKAVYTQKLGKMGRHLQMAVRGTPMEFVIPFIKTPINLLKWAVERIPGANLMLESVRTDLSGKNGGIARDMAVARMVVGGVVGTVAMGFVQNGIITGGGMADPEKRRAKMAAGWQPYSLKIGDKYYSYARIDPVARLIAAVADTIEIMHAVELDTHDKINLGGVIVAAIGNATISQTYLSGLAGAVNAITDPTRYGEKWLNQYAASMIPATGLLGQTAAAIDPQAREINGMLDAIQSRIPIWREQLLPKLNPLTGEPIKPERLFPLAPITETEASRDKVLSEAARLGVSLPSAPKKIHIGKNTGQIGNVEISPEARNAYTEAQGQFAHQLLTQIVNTSAWDGMPDMVKQTIYAKIINGARQQAAIKALPPEARIAEAVRIANEVQQQLSP